jgi:hypothetical protein
MGWLIRGAFDNGLSGGRPCIGRAKQLADNAADECRR